MFPAAREERAGGYEHGWRAQREQGCRQAEERGER